MWNILLYTDDEALVSEDHEELQNFDVASMHGKDFDVRFNDQKMSCICGKRTAYLRIRP